jgi:hypothetical protein
MFAERYTLGIHFWGVGPSTTHGRRDCLRHCHGSLPRALFMPSVTLGIQGVYAKRGRLPSVS